jgi:hypothetical protein
MAKKQAGRNTSADSLAVIARAVLAPTIVLRSAFGLSSHSRNANKLMINIAVSGTSVVARPACASSGGVVASTTALVIAATVPKS